MKIKKRKVIICLLILVLIISGIIYFMIKNNKKDETENTNIVYEKVTMLTSIHLGVSDFDNINPHLTQNKDILQIDSLVFEPLLTITEDYKITNCLASEWSKVSNKSYLIKLKENIKWQDNSKFTADDVKFTIERIQKDKKSIYLENVKNIKKAEVIDENTLRLELDKEIPFFEYQLIFPIIAKTQYEKENLDNPNRIPLGTGKYKISKIEDSKIELTKNENWRDVEKEDSNIKTISILLFKNMGEVYNAFRLGNIDLINTNNVNYEEYIGTMGYNKKQYKGREYDYLAFNCQDSVLQYKEVRQAINKIIDKEKIVTSILKENAYVTNFPLDYGNYIIQDINFEDTMEEANKILTQAGWKYEYGIWSKEIDGRTKTLNFNLSVDKDNKQRIEIAKEIKSQLENFGIGITIQELSNANYQKILDNHQYEIIFTGIYNGYSPDLNSFFGDNNLANYQNNEIKSILLEVNNISQEDLLKEKYKKVIELYQEEMPYIGIYRNQSTVVYNQSLVGDVTPNNYHIFYHFNNWYKQ